MLSEFVKFGFSSVKSPKLAAAYLLSLRLDSAARMQFALLVIVLSAIASQVIFGFRADEAVELEFGGRMQMLQTPLGVAAIEALMLTFIVLATVLVGRLFGGEGKMFDAVLLIAWLQLISLTVQTAFAIVALVGQRLGMIGESVGIFGIAMTLAILAYLFWMYVSFVTVLHSFKSTIKVLIGTVLTIVAVAFGLSSLITVFMVS